MYDNTCARLKSVKTHGVLLLVFFIRVRRSFTRHQGGRAVRKENDDKICDTKFNYSQSIAVSVHLYTAKTSAS